MPHTSNRALITFENGGQAPVISYNVPEPTSYEGQHLIAIDFPPEYFNPEVMQESAFPSLPEMDTSIERVRGEMMSGFSDPAYWPNLGVPPGYIAYWEDMPAHGISTCHQDTLAPELVSLTPDQVAMQMQNGRRLTIIRTLAGELTFKWVPDFPKSPKMILIEKYRLSSFLGSYGAGRTINTFSLLPGEKTKIVIRTFKRTAETKKETSSILDSYTATSADDFEHAVNAEQSDKQAESESHAWSVEAEASGNWGVASFNAKAGYKGGINASREQFAKNVSNATQKHAASASNKRDISVTSVTDTTLEQTEENAIEREILNLNVGRTLNFVFRQMNQEFITLLHLVDVQVAFTAGAREKARIVPLYKLDDLLQDVLASSNAKAVTARSQEIRSIILDELQNVFDYQDRPVAVIEECQLKDRKGKVRETYWRFRKDLVTTYRDPATGTQITVPGAILSSKTIVMRTDGLITEALLGQGDGLDAYSHGLQEEAVREHTLQNNLVESQVRREQMAQKILDARDRSSAEVFALLFPPPPPPVAPPPREDQDGASPSPPPKKSRARATGVAGRPRL